MRTPPPEPLFFVYFAYFVVPAPEEFGLYGQQKELPRTTPRRRRTPTARTPFFVSFEYLLVPPLKESDRMVSQENYDAPSAREVAPLGQRLYSYDSILS